MEADTLSLLTRSLNTAMVLVLAVGLLVRFRPRAHIPLMLLAFTVDLVNVFLVEVYARMSRPGGEGAVEQGIEAFTKGASFLQQFHIAVSVLCILGYIVAIITGTRLYRRGTGRRFHKANAAIFICTRLASYVTSFWM